ncbi:aminotransferase-like domain-containing protein [Sinosporangium siamense]|uniref:Transcriptional regulator PtsJ n=1 Tax=Sinosporangium siamense TaxID=1367973 RepID=A0A919RF67_9ACTN|nr:PLP-dependent aminotransferase family protein [Sinosporangium siamense]GII92781.1 transcriptional regulator PtsJ [Sinosporangium siamense]
MFEVHKRLTGLRDSSGNGRPLYERVAHELSEAIRLGELKPGERLPSVRQLATDAGLSVTTVMSVYNMLAESGLVRGEAGRGTFISERPKSDEAQAHTDSAPAEPVHRPPTRRPPTRRTSSAWRRMVLAQTEARLIESFPAAVDIMRGSPDPELLPVEAIRDAMKTVSSSLRPRDLEYPSTLSIEPELAEALQPRLMADGLAADSADMLVGNSTQQFLSLLALLLRQRSPEEPVLAGVEEPGYQTAMDTLELAGLTLIPMRLDQSGVTVEGLRAALESGVSAVFLTPRAQSPTGCSWSVERRRALADVLASYPEVWIVEDDHFAEASVSRPGSLYNDARLQDRVIYLRSFSKSIAPDLRLSLAVARPPIRHSLLMAKSFADGWTPRVSQRILAAVLSDARTDELLLRARTEYTRRRTTLHEAILIASDTHGLDASVDHVGPDGLHLWVTLPRGVDADRMVEAAARHGFLLAGGQPFFVTPGNQRHLRLNAGAVLPADAAKVAAAIRDAAVDVLNQPTALLTP